jgi:hypothetical protein
MVEEHLKGVYGYIHIGECDKLKIIKDYIKDKEINKIFIIGDELDLSELNIEYERIKFTDTIMYKYFYRWLQEINNNSLIILNECLKKQNRYDLTYNCIRRYVLQTKNRLIFNYFPIIKNEEDFMILYDMIQDNPFLKEKYEYVTHFENVIVHNVKFEISKTEITVSEEIVKQYELEKEETIAQVKKDPNIIPRRLLKFSEKHKPKWYDKLNDIKPIMNVCVSQLKVDQYYYNELLKFKEELENVIQNISR